ncbi:2-oxoglutarate dehydrogenase E1 component [Roseibacillus ishigakijimensis]|uniref:oxoglutarate dehydrogenase (succinyl-transferring) n=1 Tax=Roseibacillus ishigakijimensis TaxID=454146 RepID=A0A934RQ97_9BACT|nr:2-oxoglutarate dehydrogenase E1 component [Roseibacillus ishigakijimensis]MBK1833488.1 2-oxoglutarate dehydrogenase E1 component [Roseibacillus ishigakijimensis]
MSSSVSARLNANLLDENYERWLADPRSVDSTWAAFFEGFELGVVQAKPKPGEEPAAASSTGPANGASAVGADLDGDHNLNFLGRVVSLVYNYRTLGHTQAAINPLDEEPTVNPRLQLDRFGIGESDLDRSAATQFFRKGEEMTLREMVAALKDTYSGSIGFEFMHIHNTEIRNWIRERIEHRNEREGMSKEQQAQALRWLFEAEIFEQFVGKRFLGEKRFSLEGGEGVMVLLNRILQLCPTQGVKEIEMGMAHRGRLNVLANFVRKSIRTLLYEFTPNYVPDLVAGDGDVKYHLGYESVREVADGKVRVNLAANPSHLEAVNAVVEGKARARQRLIGDDGVKTDRTQVLPLLLHGDAAFAGQGSVAEVLNLSQLPGYRTGGTIHLIINNQIGFTTMPADARSSSYATDVAKMIEAPILHVNGEKPEELWWAAQFALEFRQKWGRDIVIDMLCYRRQGHNETDQAAFTQPHIYRKLDERKTAGQLYREELAASQAVSEEEAKALHDKIWNRLEEGYEEMRRLEEEGERTVFSGSTAVEQEAYKHDTVMTGVSEEVLKKVGHVLTDIPADFNLHPTLKKRFVPRRAQAMAEGEGIDWALAESLAWGSLLLEGYPVRLSGQDCRRGTFSQRHAVFYDHNTRERYTPLKNLGENQAKFCVYNSLLSEAAVLGFDYGYSLGCDKMLIMWEAQFGDFANGAQVIIDQFIASAESKWQTPTDLVMLLPHGYEGMGPEHSSARLERFLQLCAEKNMVVGNFTTPAQYFHALRRQKLRGFRKPLILMTPKSLLTKPEAVSTLAELSEGTSFHEVIGDAEMEKKPAEVERVIFCSGKVYYDLLEYRAKQGIDNAAIVRVEQIYPYDEESIRNATKSYTNNTKWVWCQEEPLNMGAWTFIGPRLEETFDSRIRYAGRDRASSPAAGSKAMHKREQAMLVEGAFEV